MAKDMRHRPVAPKEDNGFAASSSESPCDPPRRLSGYLRGYF